MCTEEVPVRIAEIQNHGFLLGRTRVDSFCLQLRTEQVLGLPFTNPHFQKYLSYEAMPLKRVKLQNVAIKAENKLENEKKKKKGTRAQKKKIGKTQLKSEERQ